MALGGRLVEHHVPEAEADGRQQRHHQGPAADAAESRPARRRCGSQRSRHANPLPRANHIVREPGSDDQRQQDRANARQRSDQAHAAERQATVQCDEPKPAGDAGNGCQTDGTRRRQGRPHDRQQGEQRDPAHDRRSAGDRDRPGPAGGHPAEKVGSTPGGCRANAEHDPELRHAGTVARPKVAVSDRSRSV